MADTKLEELVKRLHTQTMTGKIQWETTSDDDSFQTSFPAYTVKITQNSGMIGNDYTLTIYNHVGLIVESVTGYESGINLKQGLSPEATRLLSDTYAQARRTALKVDQALETLLSALA